MAKILHLITGLGGGGAEASLFRLLAALPQKEFPAQVVSLTDEGLYGPRLRRQGISVVALNLPQGRFTPAAWRRLRRIQREWQPDAVHAWMYHANLAAWLMGGDRPLIWSLRQAPTDSQVMKASTRLVVRLNAWLSHFCRPQVILSNSRRGLAVFAELGFAQRKLRWLPNGFDVNHYRPRPDLRVSTRARLGLAEDVPLVGLFARLHPQKRHEVFFQAALQVLHHRPEAHFLLCGRGLQADNPLVQRWLPSDARRAAFHLLGHCDDMPAWYAALDVLALSSSVEGFPNVLGEAMACGLPCVSTDAGDAAEIIDGTGRIVPVDDADALAAALLDVLSLSPSARRSLGEQARQRIERLYSLDAMAARYADLYRSLL